eukprot:Sdes_comp8882_c0_seq1m274
MPESSNSQILPALLACLPPLVSAVFGSTLGLDLGLFLVTMVWLYLVLKKPEELYSKALTNRLKRMRFFKHSEAAHKSERSKNYSAEIKALESLEHRFLVMTIASPIIGSIGLYLLSVVSTSFDTSPDAALTSARYHCESLLNSLGIAASSVAAIGNIASISQQGSSCLRTGFADFTTTHKDISNSSTGCSP